MAQVIRYVDPDATGANNGTSWADAYTSLSAWESAEQTDLVSDGDYHTVYCRSSGGTDDTTYVVINGWNTGVSNYIEIIGNDFPSNAQWDGTKYVIGTSATYDIAIYEQYVYIINIQDAPTAGSGIYPTVANCYIDSCYLNGGNNSVIGVNNQSGGTVYIYNTILEDGSQAVKNYGTAYIYNCTIYDWSGQGIYNISGGTLTAKNCAVGNCGDDFLNSGSITIDYCCSDDGDGTNSQNPSGSNWDNEFTTPGTDFSLESGGNCVGNGTDDPGSGLYSDDIIGTSRTSTWDIGAFELTSGDETVTPSAQALGATLQSPTVVVDCTVTPSTLALGMTLETPTVLAGVIVTPSALDLGLTLETPTPVIDCTVTPSALDLGLTLETPTPVIDCTVTPSTLALGMTLETPTVLAGVIVTPSALDLGLTLETPTLVINSIVTPSTLDLGISLETPTVFAGIAVTPSALDLGLTLETPTIIVDCTVTPSALDLGLTIETPSVYAGSIITPNALDLGLTLETPTISIDCTVTPSALALSITVETPNVLTDNLFSPSTFALGLTLETPTILTTTNFVAPPTLEMGMTLHEPTIITRFTDIPPAMEETLIDPYFGGAWLWLCEVVMIGQDTIRIARNTDDVDYDRETFLKSNFKIGEQIFSGDGTIPRVTLRVAQDANRLMETLINDTEGALGANIKLIKVNENFLTTPVSALEYDYDALSSESDTEYVTLTLGIPNPLTQRFPLRLYSSKKCWKATPTLFKGPECQYAGADSTCTGTYEDCYLKGNAVNWGGELGLDPNVLKV